jgi:hypothetical protein
VSLFQRAELLPKSQVLQEQVAAGTKGTYSNGGQKPQQKQHETDSTWSQAKLSEPLIYLIRRQIAILARDSSPGSAESEDGFKLPCFPATNAGFFNADALLALQSTPRAIQFSGNRRPKRRFRFSVVAPTILSLQQANLRARQKVVTNEFNHISLRPE